MSFHSAAEILERVAPQLIVSKQRRRQIENIELIRLRRDQGKQSLAFTSRPFVLCGLPVRRPPSGQLLYERRNVNFVLQITGHPDFGLPFGQDRLMPIFLATLAVRQKSQTIRFRSAAEMLDTFGMAKGGKEYRRLIAAFERIFGATMFFGSDVQTTKARVVHRARFNFLREATLWYQQGGHDCIDDEPLENVITLSDEFYQEILAHPIPTDLDIVKVLAPSPAVLDLFVWLSYRCFTAKGTESIPLFGEYGLTRQLGCVEYSRPRKFRSMIDKWLKTVRVLTPELHARIDDSGRRLIIEKISSTAKPSGCAVNGAEVASLLG